jgi:hypothetical protein
MKAVQVFATLDELKNFLGYSDGIPMNYQKDDSGANTSWFRHWDNDARKAIVMHKDNLDKVNRPWTYDEEEKIAQETNEKYTLINVYAIGDEPDVVL